MDNLDIYIFQISNSAEWVVRKMMVWICEICLKEKTLSRHYVFDRSWEHYVKIDVIIHLVQIDIREKYY